MCLGIKFAAGSTSTCKRPSSVSISNCKLMEVFFREPFTINLPSSFTIIPCHSSSIFPNGGR